MTQLAITRDHAPEFELKTGGGIYVPAVIPSPKARATRRVGTVKSYSPTRIYGLVEPASRDCHAIFRIEDVDPADRAQIDSGQSVVFEMVDGPDGRAAKHIKLDATTLPPPPDDAMISKGWR
jgi:cold shock CspA family protein